MNYQYRSRTPGFTLIELLVVMGIIMILAGIVIGVQRGVYYQQSKARAVAEMRTIASGLESFKLTYGDYPPMTRPSSMNDTNAGERLFAALTGRSILQGRGSPPLPRWFNDPNPDSNDSGATNPSFGSNVIGPVFIEQNAIKRGGTSAKPDNYWVDPWGNTYNYYYKEATSADYSPTDTSGWAGRSSFILVSPGPRNSQSLTYDQGNLIIDANLPANSRRYYNNASEGGLVPSGKVRSEIIYNYGE